MSVDPTINRAHQHGTNGGSGTTTSDVSVCGWPRGASTRSGFPTHW
ncbi:hypothetical protein J2T21_001464 [Paeniglutamicibacter psychrophenolicus]|nr:hypothetical protein [Paeniglutamicibacter psychrophenolicus]